MQRTIDAAPDTHEPAADQSAEPVDAAPDDTQAAGLVQEAPRHVAPDVNARDHEALARRPVRREPETTDAKADAEAGVAEDSSAPRDDTAQQLGQRAVDGAGAKVPVEKTDAEDVQTAIGGETDDVVAEEDTAAQRADVGARAGSRAVQEEVFTALPRNEREAPAVDEEAEVVNAEAAAQAADIVNEVEGDDPGDTGRQEDVPFADTEPVRVAGEEDVTGDDGHSTSAGDQPPSGSDGNDNNNRGRGGKGPGEGEGPSDGEPEDEGEGEEPEVAADDAEPAGTEAEPAERDPVETLRAHRNLVGGIERLLDEAIANEDEGATSATALELVTARDEMDQYIADQIAAGTLTEDQVATVRGEPLDDVELDRGDRADAAETTERGADTTGGDTAGDDAATDSGEQPSAEELNDHDRVMSELRDRVEHANRMAERLTAARDAELIAGIPVDDWLVEAAGEAAREASEYYDQHGSVLDDIELGTYEMTDGNTHFSINPAIPEVADTTEDTTDDTPSPWPPHDAPFDWAPDDTPSSKYEHTHDSPPYWDETNWPDGPEGADPKKGGWDIHVQDMDAGSGPSGDGHERQEEVKALSGSVMEHIWNKLSSLHEKIVTNTENRTIERLRIVDGVMKVDLYKVSRIENTPLPSRYYLRTGHTGIRNGIFGGFREQKPVALKSVSGNNVHAAKIIARQERRQEQLHHAHGSSGLLALATAVRTAYGAKADEHRARVIYRHEKSNFEYKQMQERQHLKMQMQHTRYLRGPQKEAQRQEIRDQLRRLRYEEHRFKQHHKSVKSQSVHRRAARGTLKASGKAIKGTAKGSAWAAKRGAKGTATAYRKTTETAANRWAARQAGPGGSHRPPRNPGSRHSGRGPRRAPQNQPTAPNGSDNSRNSEEE